MHSQNNSYYYYAHPIFIYLFYSEWIFGFRRKCENQINFVFFMLPVLGNVILNWCLWMLGVLLEFSSRILGEKKSRSLFSHVILVSSCWLLFCLFELDLTVQKCNTKADFVNDTWGSVCVCQRLSSNKKPLYRKQHSLWTLCALKKPYSEKYFSPAWSKSLWHTHTHLHIHRPSGWSVHNLTPDVLIAGQLRDDPTYQEISPVNHFVESTFHFLSFLFFLSPD